MKKIIPVFVSAILILLICIVSCAENYSPEDTMGTTENTSETESRRYVLGYDPGTAPAYVPVAEKELFPVTLKTYAPEDMEQDYDNIEVTLEKSTYSVDTLSIDITVKNLNGKCFDVFIMPYLEKWDEETESWIIIKYGTSYFDFNIFNWRSYEPETTLTYMKKCITHNDRPLIVPGIYRFEVFCGPNSFYSPTFTFE